MSRSRNAVLCVTAGLTALVINSTMAYLLGLRPALFSGLMFWLLLITCTLSWTALIVVDRTHRADAAARIRNYQRTITYARRRRPSRESGSWSQR